MKHAVLAALLAATALADSPDRMSAPRAKSSFALTADPNSAAWRKVKNIDARVDPFGKPAAANAFQFRIQWTEKDLYFLFICPYDRLTLKPSPDAKNETNKLWEWDVTEVFIGSEFDNITHYGEFQVSPQGEWVDLDIDRKNPKPEGGWKWNSGMEVKARIDESAKIWYGEMRIPISSFDKRPVKAGNEFRINVYRLAGAAPNREQIMWTPTLVRSHHTPDRFGRLVLTK